MTPKNSNLQKAMTAGATMSASLLACGGLGYFLSQQYNKDFYFLCGLILGFSVGMYEIYKYIK